MSFPSQRPLKIQLRSQSPDQLLAGLEAGLQRGLINQTNLRVTLEIDPSHPELLAGLEIWLQQGLIDEWTVQTLCRESFTCPLPPPPLTVSETTVKQAVSDKAVKPPIAKATPQPPSWLQQRWQSLQAELSLQWLLFLGVFMVVISSGVLAASQWENFPPAGQYTVLLAYTLCFWGVSVWADRQENLPSTTRTLRRVALLLLPVNFWAMDGFSLGNSILGLGVSIIATLSLSFVIFKIGKRQDFPLLLSGGYGVLSLLHLFWGVGWFPVVAVYLGVGITLGLGIWRPERIGLSPWLLYGFGILFGRAVFLAGVEISQLGLALSAVGIALIATSLWSQNYQRLGGSLLFVAWVVTVGQPFPWQAVIISFLGLGIVWQRLRQSWRVVDFVGVLLITAQLLGLGWRLFPVTLQEEITAALITFGQAEAYPYTAWSLLAFLYVIFVAGLSDWLCRHRQSRLAYVGESIVFGLGILLIAVSFVNPWLRTITFLNCTIISAIAVYRRRRFLYLHQEASGDRLQVLIYLTHILGLATGLSGVSYFVPDLSLISWGILLTTLAVVEWGFSLIPLKPHQNIIWRNSAWYLGIGLATCSYVLLASEITLWRIFWLDVPIALTVVAMITQKSRRQASGWLSSLGLIAIQPWLIDLAYDLRSPYGVILSFVVATAVMVANTDLLHIPPQRRVTTADRYRHGIRFRNRHDIQPLIAAILTVGFGLVFTVVVLAQIVPQTLATLFIGDAFILFGLWVLRRYLHRRRQSLPKIYAKAIDSWAILCCGLALLLLTLHSFLVYWEVVSASLWILLAGGITLAAIAYRSLPHPSFWGIFALGWNVEIMVAEGVGLIDSELVNLAIANFLLGLGVQLFGDWWQRHRDTHLARYWHIMPLLYSSLGAALRWGTFTRWTGLLTLTLAITFIGVGRRREGFKPLLYLALIGVTVSAYEALFYQFSLSTGGATGDGLILMSALGTATVYAYRLLSPWLRSYLHLSQQELNLFAHLHWLGSSLLLIVASFYPIDSAMTVGLATGILLIQYAIWQGRNHPKKILGEIWVYAGLIEVVGLRLYWLSLPFAEALSSLAMWKGAFAAVIAYFFYILPWESWGWSKRPWQVAALVIPLSAILETPTTTHPLSYLFAAVFYLAPAFLQRQIRYTYVSGAILLWLGYQQGQVYNLSNPLWYAVPIGLAILYFAQVDPLMRDRSKRPLRHFWRCVGVGIICLTALIGHLETGILPGIITLFVIFAGLALRIRAFLYVGTIVFLLNATYQLGILIFEYPFTKWMIGLLVGIALIWLAATFETRREQIKAFVQHWFRELEYWD
jgi:hypothetical protein